MPRKKESVMMQPVSSGRRPALRAILREKSFWMLVALWLVFYARPLFGGDSFFFRDVTYFFFPQENLFGEILRSGEFPFWDAFRHGGHPYLADLNNSPLYPTNLLFLVFPPVLAFSITLLLHYMLASCSSYLFSRVLGLQKASSFLVAVIYGFCGYLLSLNDHPTRLAAMALLPLILLGWHLFLAEGKRRYFVSAVFLGMLQVILGAPEVNVLMMLTLLGWAFGYPFPHVSAVRKVFVWILLAVSIIGIAFFQLFPTLEAVSQSSRGEGLDYQIFSQWSLFPKRLPEMLFPAFRGHLDALPYNVHFWGGDLGDSGYPYIPNIYFGCVAVALALIGACDPQKFPLPFRSRVFLGGMFLATLVLALGRFGPCFPFLYRVVPLISIFRYPIKFLLGGIFPLAFLAGCGADLLLRHMLPKTQSASSSFSSQTGRKARNMLALFWSVAVLLAGSTILLWFSEAVAVGMQTFFFNRPGTDLSHAGLVRSFSHATAIWLLFTLLLTFHRRWPRSWQPWLLVCILALDVLLAGRRVNPLAPSSYFRNEPELARLIRREIGDGKLYRAPDPLPQMFYFPVGEAFDLPPEHIMWLYRWQLETLRIYLASNYHIPVIFHRDYNMMAQRRIIQLKESIEALPWERRLPLLSAGGVSLVLTSEALEVSGLEALGNIPNWSDQPLFLYKNTRVAPRAGLVTQWKQVESDAEAQEWLLKADFDPRKHAVIQEPEQDVFTAIAGVGQREGLEEPVTIQRCEQPLDVRIHSKERRNNSSSYSVTSNCSGYFVFSEQLYPGWRVSIDGKAANVKRANLAFSAVWLEAGTHEIRRYYVPNIFIAGILCSVLCGGMLSLIVLKKWF